MEHNTIMCDTNIKRQEFIELLYETQKTNEDHRQLLNDLLSGIYTLEQCIEKYNDIEKRMKSLEFYYAIQGKPIYKNIRKFMCNSLDDIECMKLASSILTQLFIHKQQNENFKVDTDIYKMLLDVYAEYERDNKVNTEKLKNIIIELGYNEE